MDLLISGIVGIIIMEAYAWLPLISNWLLDRAVKQLRQQDQDRCREEWMAGLAALPNTFARLFHAISFIPAAQRINNASFEAELDELDAGIREVAEKHGYMVEIFGEARAQLNRSERRLEEEIDKLLLTTKAFAKEASKKGLSPQKFAEAMESYSGTLFSAYGKATELHLVSIESSSKRLVDVKLLIEKASSKLDEANEQRRNGASPDRLDALLTEVATELHAVQNIFADDKWGDDEAMKESDRIFQVVEKSALSLANKSFC
jgi:hypothetical protein